MNRNTIVLVHRTNKTLPHAHAEFIGRCRLWTAAHIYDKPATEVISRMIIAGQYAWSTEMYDYTFRAET